MLLVKELAFRYNEEGNYLWQNISFELKAGEIIVIKGANGSGKTTLLYSLCGIIPAFIEGDLTGEVLLNGKTLTKKSLKENSGIINILFQEPDKQIFMPQVEEELAFSLENLCLHTAEIRSRIADSLSLLNIEHLRYSATDTLSFGQKKLVTLASLIAISPAIFLIDEFSAGINETIISRFIELCFSLKQRGKGLILVDHNPSVIAIADRVIELK